MHSGAGRIVTLRMRPLTLTERGVGEPTVSLARLLDGGITTDVVSGRSALTLPDYTAEIVGGGFPALRGGPERAARAALDGYLQRIIEVELPDVGAAIRRPETLRRWLSAYAAATSTTASYDSIRDAATAGEGDKPAKTTTGPYRDALERLFVLEPLNAWAPTFNHLNRLSAAPKHQLADPALAARLLGMNAAALLRGEGNQVAPRDGPLLGALFESLATLVVRVSAQAAEARVRHFRSWRGEREVDLIVEREDHRVLGLEVKLSPEVDDRDVRHLLWLKEKLGEDFLGGAVLTTGKDAYVRRDGIAVIPLSLLGP
jgi:predicted AAA+ superfamily ATPase